MALSSRTVTGVGGGTRDGRCPGAQVRAPAAHLTFPGRGAQGPASSGAAAAGFPKAWAKGAGLRPRSASGVRPASGFGGTFPKPFVHQSGGPRPRVCPVGSLGPSPRPGPRPSARLRFSPRAGPRVCPAAAPGVGLCPGGGAGLGPALSAGPGARESLTYLPWPASVFPPRRNGGSNPPPESRAGGRERGRGLHLRARALGALRSRDLTWARGPPRGAAVGEPVGCRAGESFSSAARRVSSDLALCAAEGSELAACPAPWLCRPVGCVPPRPPPRLPPSCCPYTPRPPPSCCPYKCVRAGGGGGMGLAANHCCSSSGLINVF